MKKLLVGLCTVAVLGACSSNSAPATTSAPAVANCKEAKALLKSNHKKIEQAFASNDATAIGTFELQNREIVKNNRACFPKLEENIKYWKKLHQEEMQ